MFKFLQIFDGPGSNARTLAYCWFNTCALSPTLEFIANRVQLDKVRCAITDPVEVTIIKGTVYIGKSKDFVSKSGYNAEQNRDADVPGRDKQLGFMVFGIENSMSR